MCTWYYLWLFFHVNSFRNIIHTRAWLICRLGEKITRFLFQEFLISIGWHHSCEMKNMWPDQQCVKNSVLLWARRWQEGDRWSDWLLGWQEGGTHRCAEHTDQVLGLQAHLYTHSCCNQAHSNTVTMATALANQRQHYSQSQRPIRIVTAGFSFTIMPLFGRLTLRKQ